MATKKINGGIERADWWPEFVPRRFMEWFDWPAIDSVRRDEHMMHVEEFEDDGNLVVRAEMPGIDPDKDVQICVRDHTLELRAQRSRSESRDEDGVRRSEFRYGSFYRAVPLPPDATESDVHATYKDGILELRVPLSSTAPAEQTRSIPVERG